MRAAATSALCAALLLGASGCAIETASPSTQALAGTASFESVLEELPGVDDAVLELSPSGDQLDLRVLLTDDATVAQVQEVAVAAKQLREEPMPNGVFTGRIELRRGESAYAHFAMSSDDDLRAQVAYWAQITATGVESVTIRSFASTLGASPAITPGPGSSTNVPVLLGSPTARFIGLTMPGTDPAAILTIIDAIRAIPDPGASAGEWHVISGTASIKAEFASPQLPSDDRVNAAVGIANAVLGLDETASLSVRFDDSGTGPAISASLTVFDDWLETHSAATIEQAVPQSTIWPTVLDLVDGLDASGTDFSLTLLSNSIDGAGNFVLDVSVIGCTFMGDTAWPTLSVELGAYWMRGHAARFPAQAGCAVA